MKIFIHDFNADNLILPLIAVLIIISIRNRFVLQNERFIEKSLNKESKLNIQYYCRKFRERKSQR